MLLSKLVRREQQSRKPSCEVPASIVTKPQSLQVLEQQDEASFCECGSNAIEHTTAYGGKAHWCMPAEHQPAVYASCKRHESAVTVAGISQVVFIKSAVVMHTIVSMHGSAL